MEPGEYVRISIQDNGPGIPQEIADRVFDPYFSTKKEGSGLGLAITHSIISKHGGQVTVSAGKERGTVFTILLPTSAVLPEEPEAQVQKEPVTAHAVRGRVMIMDDEEMVRELVCRILERYGHEVLAVADGSEAIRCYADSQEKGAPIDLVIMDLTIPGGMGGLEALAAIKSLNPEARVIVSSGYSTDPVMAAYKKHGFMAAIVKPFKIEDLIAAVNGLMVD